MSDEMPDLDSQIERGWQEFEDALANAIRNLDDEATLRLEVINSGVPDDVTPYVQAVVTDGAVLLEAASNAFLGRSWQLSERGDALLQELGFEIPDDKDMPNYWITWPQDDAQTLAEMSISALRLAYGVIHPALLDASGLTAPAPRETVTETDAEPPAVTYPRDREHLDELVDESFVWMFGKTPHRDSDGDVPVPAGTGVVYVRSLPDAPMIRLFALMATNVLDSDAALHEVAALNRDIPGVKFVFFNDTVIASVDVPAWPFAATHLRSLLEHLREVVSSNDSTLARRVSGEVFLSEEPEYEPECASWPNGMHPAMMTILQIDAEAPGTLRPKDAAKICGYDSDLLLRLIDWNERQELAWLQARDEAEDEDEARACDHEREHAHRTVKLLRKALRKVTLG